jgi:hypothetical protein
MNWGAIGAVAELAGAAGVIFHLFFAHVELVHSHERKEILDPALLNRTYHSLFTYFGTPGVKRWWAVIGRSQFSDELVAFVEGPAAAGLKVTALGAAA